MRFLVLLALLCLVSLSVEKSYGSDTYTQSGDDTYVFREDNSSDYDSKKSEPSPFMNVTFGVILFFFSFPLLWFNERRYCITKARIKSAYEKCKLIKDANEFDPSLDQNLIHIKGVAQTSKELCDNQFYLSVGNCYKLKRKVEILQWIEHTQKNKNETICRYELSWRDNVVNSNGYRVRSNHENDPLMMIINDQIFKNDDVYIGVRKLSPSQIDQTGKFMSVRPEDAQLEAARRISSQYQYIGNHDNYIMFQQVQGKQTSGDLRISFSKVPCGDLTLVCQQKDKTFEPWQIHDKDDSSQINEDEPLQEKGCCEACCGLVKKLEAPLSMINWVFEDSLSKKQAFEQQLNQNSFITTGVRVLGWLLMVEDFNYLISKTFGIYLFFSPIEIIISYLPWFGKFLSSLTSFVFTGLSFAIGTPLSMVVIGCAWLFYRPQLAIIILACAGLILWGVFMKIQSHNN